MYGKVGTNLRQDSCKALINQRNIYKRNDESESVCNVTDSLKNRKLTLYSII